MFLRFRSKLLFLDQCVSTTVFWSSPPPIVTQYRIFSSEILSILEMMKKSWRQTRNGFLKMVLDRFLHSNGHGQLVFRNKP